MRAGELISGYRLCSDGTTDNGGRCVWAFGTKDGEEFFIKQFLSPKYPVPGEAPGSEKRKLKLREKCERFEQQQNRFMTEFGKCVCTDKCLTIPIEFVRIGPFYYKIAPKVDVSSVNIKDIAKFPLEKQLSIAKTAAHCLQTLHAMGIAHGDLKPNNILIKKTKAGEFVCRLIDFDDSFFEGGLTENIEEVVGDFVYYSPELLRYIKNGGDELRGNVTCKSDIFALGIIYYQYFYGQLPTFNKSKYKYLAVSVLGGKAPRLGGLRPRKNKKLTKLIARMLSIDPNDRPSATEIIDELNGVDRDGLDRSIEWLKKPAAASAGWLRRASVISARLLKRTLMVLGGLLRRPLIVFSKLLIRILVIFGKLLRRPLMAFARWLKRLLVAFMVAFVEWFKSSALIAKVKRYAPAESKAQSLNVSTGTAGSKSLKGTLITKRKKSS